MGTTIEAWSDAESSEALVELFEEVEQVCSRFRPDSELSLINGSENLQATPSPILADLLTAAENARSMTAGLVDVGMGRSVCAWGYDRTFEEVTGLDREPPAEPRGSWRFDNGILTRAGETHIDLGGVAKGWTCDRAVEWGLAAVVSAGGDLRSNDHATTVRVVGPSDEVDVVVTLGAGALATSSTSRRAWRVGESRVSHLIDPRTMRPVKSPIVTATVLADTAAYAEAGAKATLLLGVDGLAWAAAQPWIRGAVAFWEDGSLFATPGLEVAA